MILVLPWPPSTNRAWRRAGKHMHVSSASTTYRVAVKSIVTAKHIGAPITEWVEVKVTLYPPDMRARDEDNFAGKTLFDSLTKAGVWKDDSQIRRKVVEWGEVKPGGAVMIEIIERPDLAPIAPRRASRSKKQPKGHNESLAQEN